MNQLSMYPPTLDGESVEAKRQEIRCYFHNTFNLYEKVFELLKSDDVFYKQSEPTRHPMIFYYGHTAAFFVNKLILMHSISKRINPEFESLFAVGVDEMRWDDMQQTRYNWPKVDAVRRYRLEVRELVDKLISTLPLTLPIEPSSPFWVILMGIEHERIHIETSLVLHRQLPLEDVQKVDAFKVCQESSDAPKNGMVLIRGGAVHLGKSRQHHLYGWDNEYGDEYVEIEDFKVSKYLVSNGEFMEFVQAKGYETREYWDEEGWEFVQKSHAHHPHFWIQDTKGYKYRTLYSEIDMPLDWPVDVNALEAEAFCRFKSKQDAKSYHLLNEAEYAKLAQHAAIDDILLFDQQKANRNFHYGSSCPVNKFAFDGVYDVVGNVWQWSQTPIYAFDGFEVHPAYDDFSTPTFDNRHALIFGGSWASSGNLLMRHARYAFRKHFFQHAGFRYVESSNTQVQGALYETDELVAQYCEFQYAQEEYFGVKNFALACVEFIKPFIQNNSKALDLGCATGRASFELAKFFDEVDAIDFSARFIGVGVKLQEEGIFYYKSKEEGDVFTNKIISLDALDYSEVKEKVNFWQGDACNLKSNFQDYDVVLATNLIDRLYNPALFLESIAQRIKDGGILMISSPYTWQESSTEKSLWLGGFYDEHNKAQKSLQGLHNLLEKEFELLRVADIPFVIKETARKFQHTIAEVSMWRKKGV